MSIGGASGAGLGSAGLATVGLGGSGGGAPTPPHGVAAIALAGIVYRVPHAMHNAVNPASAPANADAFPHFGQRTRVVMLGGLPVVCIIGERPPHFTHCRTEIQ
jgi:hypothetical protein